MSDTTIGCPRAAACRFVPCSAHCSSINPIVPRPTRNAVTWIADRLGIAEIWDGRLIRWMRCRGYYRPIAGIC